MDGRRLSDVIDDLDDVTSLRFLAEQARVLGLDPHAVVTVGAIAVEHLNKYGRLCSRDVLAMLAKSGECVCPTTDGERHPVQCPKHPDEDRRRRELARVLTGAVRCGLVSQESADRWMTETDGGESR